MIYPKKKNDMWYILWVKNYGLKLEVLQRQSKGKKK